MHKIIQVLASAVVLVLFYLMVFKIDLRAATTTKVEDNAVVFKTGYFKRANIDGVDCVIGSSGFDGSVALSCNWEAK